MKDFDEMYLFADSKIGGLAKDYGIDNLSSINVELYQDKGLLIVESSDSDTKAIMLLNEFNSDDNKYKEEFCENLSKIFKDTYSNRKINYSQKLSNEIFKMISDFDKAHDTEIKFRVTENMLDAYLPITTFVVTVEGVKGEALLSLDGLDDFDYKYNMFKKELNELMVKGIGALE